MRGTLIMRKVILITDAIVFFLGLVTGVGSTALLMGWQIKDLTCDYQSQVSGYRELLTGKERALEADKSLFEERKKQHETSLCLHCHTVQDWLRDGGSLDKEEQRRKHLQKLLDELNRIPRKMISADPPGF
jgi:hypothetical protein